MIIKPLPAFLTTTAYDVAEGLKVRIKVRENPYHLPLEALFQMALRKNPKRRFLFVSKVLGKHLPVRPEIPGLGGRALALCYVQKVFGQNHEAALGTVLKSLCAEDETDHELSVPSTGGARSIYSEEGLIDLPERTVFIGFAETATALGYSVFSSFKSDAQFIHTTRENLENRDVMIRFEEEHSHATAHRLYSVDATNPLKGSDTLVLVDDEITTGKTALNIIEAIQNEFPRKKYALLSLLDWRSQEDIEAFAALEKRLGISITTVSLIAGEIEVEDDGYDAKFYDQCELENAKKLTDYKLSPSKVTTISLNHLFNSVVDASSIAGDGRVSKIPYLRHTGRFGLDSSWIGKNYEKADQAANEIMSQIPADQWGSNCLVLGTGEFMQFPVMVAQALVSKLPHSKIVFHSTTRSPICPLDHENYGARSAYRFACPEDATVLNHVYNIRPGAYDTLVVLNERWTSEASRHELMKSISAMGIPNVVGVFCCS